MAEDEGSLLDDASGRNSVSLATWLSLVCIHTFSQSIRSRCYTINHLCLPVVWGPTAISGVCLHEGNGGTSGLATLTWSNGGHSFASVETRQQNA